MAAGGDRPAPDRGVRVGRRETQHDLDVLALEQLVDAAGGEPVLGGDLLAPVRRRRPRRRRADAVEARRVVEIDAADGAAPDQPDAESSQALAALPARAASRASARRRRPGSARGVVELDHQPGRAGRLGRRRRSPTSPARPRRPRRPPSRRPCAHVLGVHERAAPVQRGEHGRRIVPRDVQPADVRLEVDARGDDPLPQPVLAPNSKSWLW